MKKLLLVFAHPDDESFACGGTAAKYSHNGWDVELVCATRGEAGDRGPFDKSTESTGDIRQRELEKSIHIIGISRISFLGFKDTLMPKLAAGELEESIYKVFKERKPDVVITFEPSGVTNHPDHRRLTVATTYAFQKYTRSILIPYKLLRKLSGRSAIPKEIAERTKDADQPKLYYVCLPESVLTYLQRAKVLPRDSHGEPIRGVPDESITTTIDISRFAVKKAHALNAHQTQQKVVEPFLSMPNNPLATHEYFILRMIGINEYFMGKKDRVSDKL